jgi:hypothetical protein
MKSSMTSKSPLPTQQEIERHYFERFRIAYPLPPGTVVYGDKPDVTITGVRTVGIEITNLYVEDGANPASEQVQAKHRHAAVSLAQDIYDKSGGSNIEMTLGFDEDRPIRDVPAVAAKIAALAEQVKCWDNGQIRKHHFEHIPELDFAYLYARQLQYDDEPDPKFPNGQPDPSEGFTAFAEYRNRREARALRAGIYKPLPFCGKWKLGQAHSFGLMSAARLTEIIAQKEAKARHYSSCDEYWLLVVVDFMNAAQEQEIRVDGLVVDSDVFERIIIYKPHFEHIVEVTRERVSAR